ncbi:hypothetical protein F4815DRAFT_448263 [Daldinia loculata]|nr:hypothetical protein F4815DRAFT_448263 [Daldinia loculata]
MAGSELPKSLLTTGCEVCIPNPTNAGQSFLERLPNELHRMIFEECDLSSRNTLVQTCRKLRFAGLNCRLKRLERVKLKDTLEFLEADLLMLASHPDAEIIRTHTTCLSIAITTIQRRSGVPTLNTINPEEAGRQLNPLPALISKMEKLQCLKIDVERLEIDKSLCDDFQDAMCSSFEALGNSVLSSSLQRLIILGGFTTPKVFYILRVFSHLRYVVLNYLCFQEAQPLITGEMHFKTVKGLQIELSPDQIGALEHYRRAAQWFPNVEYLEIGWSRWSEDSQKMEIHRTNKASLPGAVEEITLDVAPLPRRLIIAALFRRAP